MSMQAYGSQFENCALCLLASQSNLIESKLDIYSTGEAAVKSMLQKFRLPGCPNAD